MECTTRSIKENLWKRLEIRLLHLISAGRACNVNNKGLLIKFLANHLAPAWIHVQQAKLGAVSMVISVELGVLDALPVVVGNYSDLLVEVRVTAPIDAQLYMLRPSKSNTSVRHHQITEYSRWIQCTCSLLSLHNVIGCYTRSVLQQRKNITCEISKEYTFLAQDVSAFNISQATTKDLNRYKVLLHLHVPDFTSLDAFRQFAYTHATMRLLILTILSPISAAASRTSSTPTPTS